MYPLGEFVAFNMFLLHRISKAPRFFSGHQMWGLDIDPCSQGVDIFIVWISEIDHTPFIARDSMGTMATEIPHQPGFFRHKGGYFQAQNHISWGFSIVMRLPQQLDGLQWKKNLTWMMNRGIFIVGNLHIISDWSVQNDIRWIEHIPFRSGSTRVPLWQSSTQLENSDFRYSLAGKLRVCKLENLHRQLR